MYILSKQFSDKFNRLYTKSMNDKRIDNYEYSELVKAYEDYKKNRSFFRLKLLVLSNNNIFRNNNININIYPGTGFADRYY